MLTCIPIRLLAQKNKFCTFKVQSESEEGVRRSSGMSEAVVFET